PALRDSLGGFSSVGFLFSDSLLGYVARTTSHVRENFRRNGVANPAPHWSVFTGNS
ncbi:MAG: hypothetical protein RIR39_1600, partial [Pseudomonadota bacterium]